MTATSLFTDYSTSVCFAAMESRYSSVAAGGITAESWTWTGARSGLITSNMGADMHAQPCKGHAEVASSVRWLFQRGRLDGEWCFKVNCLPVTLSTWTWAHRALVLAQAVLPLFSSFYFTFSSRQHDLMEAGSWCCTHPQRNESIIFRLSLVPVAGRSGYSPYRHCLRPITPRLEGGLCWPHSR